MQHFIVFVATEYDNINHCTGITTHAAFSLGSPECPSSFALFRQANADAAKTREGSVIHKARAALALASQDTRIAAVLNAHLAQLPVLAASGNVERGSSSSSTSSGGPAFASVSSVATHPHAYAHAPSRRPGSCPLLASPATRGLVEVRAGVPCESQKATWRAHARPSFGLNHLFVQGVYRHSSALVLDLEKASSERAQQGQQLAAAAVPVGPTGPAASPQVPPVTDWPGPCPPIKDAHGISKPPRAAVVRPFAATVRACRTVSALAAEYYSYGGTRDVERRWGEGRPGVPSGWSWRGTRARALFVGPNAPSLTSLWSQLTPM